MSNDGNEPELPLTKVAFVLDGGPLTISGTVSEEPDAGAETMWAEVLGDGCYRLRNSPFKTYGVSFYDVVAAEIVDGQLTARRIVSRGGHSTYRVLLAKSVAKEQFLAQWPRFAALSCNHENADGRLFAIDVRPEANIRAVYAELERGEKDGFWRFEEAHCGHAV